ncbi:MAG: hypothetical protein IJC81_05460 [Clostridia bacterium]|nr:hypothetical protein [Clostridia bacterium]
MKKYLSLLLAILMILSVSLYGCGVEEVTKKDSEEETEEVEKTEEAEKAEETEVNYEDIPLLSAEEYFMENINAEMADYEKISDNMRISFAVADPLAIAKQIPDYEEPEEQIPVKDLVLNLFTNTEQTVTVIDFAGKINDKDATATLYADAEKREAILASNLIKEVYSLPAAEEEAGVTVSFNNQDMTELVQFFVDNMDEIYKILLDNSTTEVVDNGKVATVKLTVTASQLYDMGEAMYITFADEEAWVSYIESFVLMTEYTEMTYEDLLAELAANKESTKAEFEELKLSINWDTDFDKLTNMPVKYDLVVNINDVAWTIAYELKGDAATVVIDIPDIHTALEDVTDVSAMPKAIKMTMDVVDTDDKTAITVALEMGDVSACMTFEAKDGKFDISLDAKTPEYEYVEEEVTEVWEGEEYTYIDYVEKLVGTTETSLSLAGTYKYNEKTFEIVPATFVYNDLEIPLDVANIRIDGEVGCNLPEAPAATANFEDLGPWGAIYLMGEVYSSLGLEMDLGGAMPGIEF